METSSQFQFPYLLATDRMLASPPDAIQSGMLSRVLDEIDHGLLLLDLTGRILHANFPARRELSSGHALRSSDGVLCAGQCQPAAEAAPGAQGCRARLPQHHRAR
ncbi:hypothetical protein ACQ858_23180 [Variovorax ureilyticus]|uniref:hypothetical protein n=1 Tax=Variovorax ureilyticus TaxID=1836198 RepID=UPI003D669726